MVSLANCKGVFKELFFWVRRRLRGKQVGLWMRPTRLHRRLRLLGYHGEFSKIRMISWRTSKSPHASYSMPSQWFREMGFYQVEGLNTGVLREIR